MRTAISIILFLSIGAILTRSGVEHHAYYMLAGYLLGVIMYIDKTR